MQKTLSIIVLIVIALFGCRVAAQVDVNSRIDSIMNAHVLTGDTIPHIDLEAISIRPERVFKNRRSARRYWRLVYNLKKVIPYSKIIATEVKDVDIGLSRLETDRERRKYIKSVEDSLWSGYEKDMRQMTISQGRLLFKLVDRETSGTTYYWIEEYRGKVSAFFWQGVARLFSSNLKSEYDPEGKDKLIEELILDIERGYI
ncbi:MAG: DUF4294 domain-containing protein [Bacteroidales bacterium]|nr:DUF4294 domain-containing protein [Bacteroidales bacterium]